MSRLAKQIPVFVRIGSKDDDKEVTYTYIDPQCNKLVRDSKSCILRASQPYYTLFAIDYVSSMAGWRFHPVSPVIPKPDAMAPTFTTPEDRLSLRTLDQSPDTYRFDFIFNNVITGSQAISDPQEGNHGGPGPDD